MLLLLAGCWTVTESYCETTERVATDDEVFDFGSSIADILADIATASVKAMDLDGTAVSLDVSVARAEGEARVTDAAVIDEVIWPGGPNTRSTWLSGNEPCADILDVPVTLTMVDADGRVDLSGAATLSNETNYPEDVALSVDYVIQDADVLPEGLHGVRTGGTVHIGYFRGALTELRAEGVAADGTMETVLWYKGVF